MKLFLTISIFLLSTLSLSAQQITFENVADQLGISFSRDGGFFGGGVSFCDFDGDGLDDISFSSRSNNQLMIYKNTGNSFSLITEQLGVFDSSDVRTILWADYDNDGDKDLFLATTGSSDKLYRNDQNNFINVSLQSGISPVTNYSTAAAWADYDNDGDIDLYVCVRDDLNPNILYKNQGNGTFVDITDVAGVGDTIGGTSFFKIPLAVSFFDYNNDYFQDIYIANDKHYGNTLFKNNGDGTFTDVSSESNSDVSIDGMGVAIGDFDNNGYQDIYSTNTAAGNVLLKNNGDGTFAEIAELLNVTVNKTCWGANFFDFDNDTDLDLYVSAMPEVGYTGENELFENMNDGTFQKLALPGLNTENLKSHGNAVADFNNDGFVDIAVINGLPDYSSLWRNSGNSNNWLKLKLEGVISNRDGIGSRIDVYLGTNHFIRSTHCGHSYLSQNSSTQTIGVGAATQVDSILIRWPSGTVDVLRNVIVNASYLIEEGTSVTDVDEEDNLPTSYTLLQNYPNPFNPSTNISFSLAEASVVKMSVYNLLGQQVAVILNEVKEAGLHSVTFNASILPSGTYFYTIETPHFKQTKKMLLTK